MIELINVKKSYGDKTIIKDISFSVERGERIAIIGGSGCGKSTTLRLILGLHFATSGKVMIDGQDISQLDTEALRQIRLKMGMLFQSAALFDSMTVEQNVAFTLTENTNMTPLAIKRRVNETLEMVEMMGYGDRMPSELSGGQQKRIGLARAIAHRPSIILYDEPTTGLDPVLSTNIENLIIKLSEKLNATSVVVTHQISTILRTAEQIYMIDNGYLYPPETPNAIMTSDNQTIRHFMNGGLEANG